MRERSFQQIHLYRDPEDGLLKSDCYVARAYLSDNSQPALPGRKFKAMWDTGSNACMLTSKVVELLQLKEEASRVRVLHVRGVDEEVPRYTVGLTLSNSARFGPMQAALRSDSNYDFLIGMNIINQGDLLILNGGENPGALFRYPSIDDGGLGLTPQESTSRQRSRPRTKRRRNRSR